MAQSNWIGKTLNGRYQITELLGQGGMSAVYKANDPNLRRVVAIKIIHSHLSSDPEFVRRFEEEAAAVAQLRHPNLIQVFDFNNDDDTYYIVFEYVPGETVQQRLKRLREVNRSMGIAETTKIIAQAADGLNYAHNKGLVHRDIKPANIMLNVQNNPIVMDFGIAKIMGGTLHTATGAVLGTAPYMSPEQIKGERIDPRTDIYSLGITMFEMLGGRPPFNADSAMTLMMMHVTDPVPDLRQIRPDVPASLVAIVNKSLAKNPGDRFQTAAEFAAALQNPNQAATAITAAALETSGAQKLDPDKTVLEPVISGAAITGAAAQPAAGQAPPSQAAPIIPRTPAPDSSASSSKKWLYIAGGALALILLLGGIWAVFLRDGSGDVEPAAVAVVATETVAEVVATEEPTQEPEPTAAPTEAPTEEPTARPTAEPLVTAPLPGPRGSVASTSGDVTLLVDGEELPAGADTPITAGTQITTGENSSIEFELEDGSIIQLGASSILEVRDLAEDPGDSTQKSILELVEGDFLLRQPQPGNLLELLDSEGNLLGSLQAAASASAKPARAAARLLAQGADSKAVMAVSLSKGSDEIRVSCFIGTCTIGDSFTLPAGQELIIDRAQRAISSQNAITEKSASFSYWQEACTSCLPNMAEVIVEAPPTATTAPPTATNAPPTATFAPPTATFAAPTATFAAPTATFAPPTPTSAAPTATFEPPTAEPTATTEAPPQLSVSITGIDLVDGRYYVYYETYGYTEQLPGTHVHFFFDTVAESNAGVPGSGPWKLYGGPRPFTEYAQSDRYGAATAMCARVANADHSIIYGSGNCWPLPQ